MKEIENVEIIGKRLSVEQKFNIQMVKLFLNQALVRELMDRT